MHLCLCPLSLDFIKASGNDPVFPPRPWLTVAESICTSVFFIPSPGPQNEYHTATQINRLRASRMIEYNTTYNIVLQKISILTQRSSTKESWLSPKQHQLLNTCSTSHLKTGVIDILSSKNIHGPFLKICNIFSHLLGHRQTCLQLGHLTSWFRTPGLFPWFVRSGSTV